MEDAPSNSIEAASTRKLSHGRSIGAGWCSFSIPS